MTAGMLLNRPTDLLLCEDVKLDSTAGIEEDNMITHEWNVWYGGHEHGLHTHEPMFHCLHPFPIKEYSHQVIDGIYLSALQDARQMVKNYGKSHSLSPKDFWTFSGMVTWTSSDELISEIEDGLWYAAAMDASVVKKGLGSIVKKITSGKYADTNIDDIGTTISMGNERDYIWKLFMRLIGYRMGKGDIQRSGKCSQHHGNDRMLEEWCRENLVFGDLPRFTED